MTELSTDVLKRFPKCPAEYPSLNPVGYNLTHNGVSFPVQTKDGVYQQVVCNHPILPIETLKSIDTGHERMKIAFRRRNTWTEIAVDRDVIASKNQIVQLSKLGVDVSSETAKHLTKYLMDVDVANEDNIPIVNSVSRVGWVENNEFIPYCKNVVFDGNSGLIQSYESIKEHGDSSIWIEEVKNARAHGNIALRILLAASFASVLIHPMRKLPFVVHLWGGTGAGKTVGLLMAASVWGNPNEGHIMRTFNSTQVSTEMLATFYNSLPVCMNELQLTKDDKNRSLDKEIYAFCEGAGKGRSNKNLGLNKIGTWKNVMLTNGEWPIIKDNSGAGAANRVIEIECRGKLFEKASKSADIFRQNYGFYGKKWVEWIQKDGSIEELTRKFEFFNEKICSSAITEKQSMSAALIATADYFITRELFLDGKNITTKEIMEFLKSNASVSQEERAYQHILSEITMNSGKFKAPYQNEVWGRFEGDSNNPEWAIIVGNKFDQIMEKGGYSGKAVLSWMRDNKLIDAPEKSLKTTVWLEGCSVRCVKLRLNRTGFKPTDEPHPFE